MTSEYYKNTEVRKRIIEYLGGNALENATCAYVTRCDVRSFDNIETKEPGDLTHYLDHGLDVCRSLWDHKSLIAHLDVEYVNFDFPAEPYLDLERTFEIQQPVVLSIEKTLLKYGIAPLHLISGRGHHFVWQISRASKALNLISIFGQIPDHLKAIYHSSQSPTGETVPLDLGAGFSGLGMIMEYLAHQLKEKVTPQCKLPVELTAVTVGPENRGREIISIDISEYGDPLHTRMIRVPFSPYLKPWAKDKILHDQIADEIPRLFMIPLHEMDISQALKVMVDQSKVAELAKRASVKIPDQSKSMENLVCDYEKSDVRKYHDWFYSQEHEPPVKWDQTYDLTPLEILPHCVSHILTHPNELLLKPAEIELATKSMLALGWHPRHIAGLMRSKYERDYNWGSYWLTYDAATRADFYTRMFTGLFVVGRDDLTDFNCLSTKEKGMCLNHDMQCNLDEFRESLLERRKHERLASRPFNRLFLPDGHL